MRLASTTFSASNIALWLLLLACIGGLGYGVEQSDFVWIGLLYAGAFGVYAWVCSRAKEADLYFWLGVAVLARVLLLGAFPALSDDIYRFVWDGHIWLAGQNPFDHLPSWYQQAGNELPGLTPELYGLLNSPEYYTIYPPVAQFTFVVSTWLSPESVAGAAVMMKLFLLAAELGSIYLLLRLLQHWKLPNTRVLWYALNPLILVEVMGNLHFEGMMIFFLLLGVWWLTQARWWASASALALAIASKLLPLMFLPFLIRRLGWRRSVAYFAVLGAVLLASWLPILSSSFIQNFSSSVELYFQRFEFNASLFYFLKWVGYQTKGYNLIQVIGPNLAKIVLVVILLRAVFDKGRNYAELPSLWLFAISVYLLCATTVHPWYSALPLVLAIFTSYRWPMLWTGLITLTYINYWLPGVYEEDFWVVGIEYILVIGFGIWEWLRPGRTNRKVAENTGLLS